MHKSHLDRRSAKQIEFNLESLLVFDETRTRSPPESIFELLIFTNSYTHKSKQNSVIKSHNMLPVPSDRTSGRRSSSIGCRSLVGRRTSTYITSQSSTACDPFKASHFFHRSFFIRFDFILHNRKRILVANKYYVK